MPAVEELLPRFFAAHTQVLGVSVDSVHSHANWGRDLGGVSFPLLADFHPKGAMARSVGAYLDEAGITDRATVFIDSGGTVRHASTVTPSGRRDIAELAALCEELDRAHGAGLPEKPKAPGLPDGCTLHVKSSCGFSRATLLARDNLHLEDALPVRNVTDDAGAREALVALAGNDTAPCLVADGKPTHEAADIIAWMVERTAPLTT